jgi:hypothetical protein
MFFELVMLGMIALDNQKENRQTTILIGKGPNFIGLVPKLSKQAL